MSLHPEFRYKRLRSLLCLGLALLALAPFVITKASTADPFFPRSGDESYDALHYDIHLSFQPSSGDVRAKVAIRATPLLALSRFSLDLDGLRVTSVTVDGARAGFARSTGKLEVTLSKALAAGVPFTVVIGYRGRPQKVIEPGGLLAGWIRTGDGAIAIGEAVGTASWLACNNSLGEKASFDFHLTVPNDLKGVANGRLISVTKKGSNRTFHWRESEPMDPYLAVIDIGKGQLLRSTIDGIPAWTMVEPKLAKRWRKTLAALPAILRFETKIFGPYPFDAVGSIVDSAGIDVALETQTRPIYSLPPSPIVLVHEMAHQWFGASVGLQRWSDVWLVEGFATWTQWYYEEKHGGPSALKTFERLRRTPDWVTEVWNPPPGIPGKPKHLFATSIYLRGAMALEALRIKVGTATVLRILRTWAAANRYSSVSTYGFIELADTIASRNLQPFFRRWLFVPGKP
jgi:aminopeptidase N